MHNSTQSIFQLSSEEEEEEEEESPIDVAVSALQLIAMLQRTYYKRCQRTYI